MSKKDQEIPIPFSLDDFYTTQQERDEDNKEKVELIDINKIDSFKNHPFRVTENEELNQIIESIKNNGFFDPVLIRPTENGRYEMVSGHRRMKACQMLGMKTIPSHVRNLTDDEATIIMVDSNLQREKLLPSEKAKAYKLKLDAISHQGKRVDLTCGQVGHKLEKVKSRDAIAKNSKDSARNIQRYIRLTFLIPELLQLVDNEVLGKEPSMAFNPAVELSYLTNDHQEKLWDIIKYDLITPSLAQAIKLRKLSQDSYLDYNDIKQIMGESKPNETPKLRVSMNRLNGVLPNTLRNDREREEYVINAVIFYDKYQKQRLKNQHER